MHEENPLDRMVHQFQDRWETSPHYRAAMGGALTIMLIVVLALATTVASVVASRALTAFGFGGGDPSKDQQQGLSGVQGANGQLFFPTQTIAPWTSGATPGAGTIPPSGTAFPTATPLATPTDPPSPTPCRSNCPTPLPAVTITGSYNLPAWTNGMGILSLHTSAPNDGIAMYVHIPGRTVILSNEEASAPRRTDANGDATWNMATRAAGWGAPCAGTVTIDIAAQSPVGASNLKFGKQVAIPCP